jgi:transcriptional regulator with XRE-family HTH domain
MSEREREVCSRVRFVRTLQRLSQGEFARLIGVTRDKLAAVESEYSPLRFSVGVQICERCNVCQRWLAQGIEPAIGKLVFPLDLLALVPPRALFSEGFDRFLKDEADKLILQTHDTGIGIQIYEAAGGTPKKSAEHYAGLLSSIWFQRYDIPKQVELFRWLNGAAGAFAQSNKAFIIPSVGKVPGKSKLTFSSTTDKDEDMQGKWPALKKQLQEATKKTGKSALAKFLKVDLTRVSQWLTDAKSQREPGAEYALQMQDWLKRQT